MSFGPRRSPCSCLWELAKISRVIFVMEVKSVMLASAVWRLRIPQIQQPTPSYTIGVDPIITSTPYNRVYGRHPHPLGEQNSTPCLAWTPALKILQVWGRTLSQSSTTLVVDLYHRFHPVGVFL